MRHLICKAGRHLTRTPWDHPSSTLRDAGRAFLGSSNSGLIRERHGSPLIPQPQDFDDGNKDLVNSISEHQFSIDQTSAKGRSDGRAAAILPGATPGLSNFPSQAGFPAHPAYHSHRTLPQTVCQHLHRSGVSALSSSLPNPLSRSFTQLVTKPSSKPELNLWEHGPSVCNIAFPSPGMNPGVRFSKKLGKVLCSRLSELQGSRFVGDNSSSAHVSLSQSLHIRGFRTGGSFRLADEKNEVSEVTVTENKVSEVEVTENEGSEITATEKEAEIVPEGRRPYGPRRSKRIPRSIIGSYDEEFEDELDLAEPSPWQDVQYNVRPRMDKFFMDELGANPPLDLEELVEEADDLGLVSEIPDSYAGLPLVLRWETRFVLAPGPNAHHPLNRKVKLQAFLRDLDLSAKARERMIALVGPRFDRRKDELTLISQRYSHREENRKDVLRILYELIEESRKADTEGEELAAVA